MYHFSYINRYACVCIYMATLYRVGDWVLTSLADKTSCPCTRVLGLRGGGKLDYV
jgi:hypothetical protein